MEDTAKILELQDRPGAAAGGLRSRLRDGRFEVTTAGFDPNLQLVGGDPWGTPTFTGLVVPSAPTASLGFPSFRFRYLFLLARAQFNEGERVRLVGLREYASLVAPSAPTSPSLGSGCPLEFPIESPMWRFCDANISWHVRLIPKITQQTRNPLNTDSVIFRDALAPALIYQTLSPYSPPNAGRPPGRPIRSDLGNMHDLRYPWRDSEVEEELDIPIPPRSDVAVYVSVAQHDPAKTLTLTPAQALAAAPEDRFWAAFGAVQYGRVAASLIFKQEDWVK